MLAAFNPLHARDVLSSATAGTGSSCSVRFSWASPVERRSTPTWDTSVESRSGWRGFRLVLPALFLNYLGQGAMSC